MTNGSSQGLFVIVAVVIFGIFVLISYLLFGDKMKTSLASIFDTGIEQVDLDNNPEGIEETEESQFIFNKETGTVEGLKPAFEGKESQINIPEEIKGEPVVSIEDNAFKDEQFTTLVLPDSVESIGENAFYSSPIANLSVKKNVVVGKDAFYTAERMIETEITFSGNAQENGYGDSKSLLIGNQPVFDRNILRSLNANANLRQGATEFMFDGYDYELDTYSGELQRNAPDGNFSFKTRYDLDGKLNYKTSLEESHYLEISSDQFSEQNVTDLFNYITNNSQLNPDMSLGINVIGSNVIKKATVNGKEFPVTSVRGTQKTISFKIKDIPNLKFDVKNSIGTNSHGSNKYPLNTDYDFYLANTNTNDVKKENLKDYLGFRYSSGTKHDALDLTQVFDVEIETSSGQIYKQEVTYTVTVNSSYHFGSK